MTRARAPLGAIAALSAVGTLAAGGAASVRAQTEADPRLLEAIDWYTGVAGRVDDTRAAELLVEAADTGDPLAVMWMARVLSRGRMGYVEDVARARDIASGVIGAVRALAARGDVEASFLLGTAYDEGLGVAPDPEEALRWYRSAARMGHVLAAHNVGNVHRNGLGVPADASVAVAWWLRAAHAGDVIPALRLGEAYEAGLGVRVDPERARRWYERAAAAGNATAAVALGRLAR
jgi:TPR repeat protein